MNFKTSHARTLFLATSALTLASAFAPARAQTVMLDAITITATKTAEAVSDALAASSVIGPEQIEQTRATSAAELFRSTPGVWFQNRADDPSLSINIRGLQDFGRVATLIDGARQNMQRTGHSANGQMYIEPNTIAGIDITRGPTATIYGSGAIGGVVYFPHQGRRGHLEARREVGCRESRRIQHQQGLEHVSSRRGARRREHGFVLWRYIPRSVRLQGRPRQQGSELGLRRLDRNREGNAASCGRSHRQVRLHAI